jgi:hypothetical protein
MLPIVVKRAVDQADGDVAFVFHAVWHSDNDPDIAGSVAEICPRDRLYQVCQTWEEAKEMAADLNELGDVEAEWNLPDPYDPGITDQGE